MERAEPFPRHSPSVLPKLSTAAPPITKRAQHPKHNPKIKSPLSPKKEIHFSCTENFTPDGGKTAVPRRKVFRRSGENFSRGINVRPPASTERKYAILPRSHFQFLSRSKTGRTKGRKPQTENPGKPGKSWEDWRKTGENPRFSTSSRPLLRRLSFIITIFILSFFIYKRERRKTEVPAWYRTELQDF